MINESRVRVGCYYFPNYHVDPRNEKIHGPGWTEWQLVRHATPRFPDHQQPKVPFWGHEDESKPEVMEQKIDAAVDHGIDHFLFDWYHYEDGPFLERCLEQGFLKARNVNRIDFALMWANHDWCNVHPMSRTFGKELLYPGRVSPKMFRFITDLILDRYFSHPSYLKVDGCPYFSIYDLAKFVEIHGSVESTRKAIDGFRERVRAAGFPDLHFNAVAWGKPVLPGEKVIRDLPQLIAALGFVGEQNGRGHFPGQHADQFPGQVMGIAHAAVHALSGIGRSEVCSVTGEQHTVDLPAFGDAGVKGVHGFTHDGDRCIALERA